MKFGIMPFQPPIWTSVSLRDMLRPAVVGADVRSEDLLTASTHKSEEVRCVSDNDDNLLPVPPQAQRRSSAGSNTVILIHRHYDATRRHNGAHDNLRNVRKPRGNSIQCLSADKSMWPRLPSLRDVHGTHSMTARPPRPHQHAHTHLSALKRRRSSTRWEQARSG